MVYERRAQAHARRGHGGFAAGVTGADDDDVVLFGEWHGCFYFTEKESAAAEATPPDRRRDVRS